MKEMEVRVWNIIESSRESVFITHAGNGYARARTMNRIQDYERAGGVFWYATERRSKKVKEIKENSKVTLFFTHPESADFANVFGTAEIVDDKETRYRFWNDEWKQYWKGGPDDPEYVLIRVNPESGEYFFNAEVKQGKIEFKENVK